MLEDNKRDPITEMNLVLGEEWSNKDSFEQVVRDFIKPYLSKDKKVLEIGVGGGRVARKVAGEVEKLEVLDISSEMLKTAKQNLS